MVPDSHPNSPANAGRSAQSAQSGGNASEVMISSAEMENIFHNWYNIDIDFEHEFPDEFQTVPVERKADQLWRKPMNSKEVIDRLIGSRPNDATGDHIIEPIMEYFEEVVLSATKQFTNIQRRYSDNKHHLEVLLNCKRTGHTPRFLKLNTPEIDSAIFPEERIKDVKADIQAILDKASEGALDRIIRERESIDASLRQEAEKTIKAVKESAKNEWMEAQTAGRYVYNRWDNLFPVYALVTNGDREFRQETTLSATVFRAAMKESQRRICTEIEKEMQKKTNEHKARRRDAETRREVLSKASSIPQQEAEKTLAKRMDEIITAKLAPLTAELRQLKNASALDRTGPARADLRRPVSKQSTDDEEGSDHDNSGSKSKQRTANIPGQRSKGDNPQREAYAPGHRSKREDSHQWQAKSHPHGKNQPVREREQEPHTKPKRIIVAIDDPEDENVERRHKRRKWKQRHSGPWAAQH